MELIKFYYKLINCNRTSLTKKNPKTSVLGFFNYSKENTNLMAKYP